MTGEKLLRVEGLKKHFPIEKGFFKKVVGHVRAVDDVSLSLAGGETLGLVGESGCGKTTLGRCILRAMEPTTGRIVVTTAEGRDVDLLSLGHEDLRVFRRDMQLIFQDPYSSLNPRMTVLDIVGEPLRGYGIASGSEREDRVRALVKTVGLDDRHLHRYPHAFSGGQRQRINIARALATSPRFIVADEPVSALDVSVQAQILNLMQDLQRQFGFSYLFISHDLSVIQHISDRVAVMYLGRIVETGMTGELFFQPRHPYAEALLTVVPVPDPRAKVKRVILEGEVPSPSSPPPGCHFHPRCKYCVDVCRAEYPPLREVTPDHAVACHRADELTLHGVGG